MKGKRLLAVALAMGFFVPALALSDPFSPCKAPPVPTPTPLSTGAILDLVVTPLVANGISILLLGAFAVVGVPWVLAALGVALMQLPEKLRPRR